MDLLQLIHGFAKVSTWICYSWCMDFSKLLCGYVKVVPRNSRPLPNKTKLKFGQDCKACWSFWLWLKVLNELKYSMHWVCCAFGNIFSLFCLFSINDHLRPQQWLFCSLPLLLFWINNYSYSMTFCANYNILPSLTN